MQRVNFDGAVEELRTAMFGMIHDSGHRTGGAVDVHYYVAAHEGYTPFDALLHETYLDVRLAVAAAERAPHIGMADDGDASFAEDS